MTRRDDEEFYARQDDLFFICEVTFTDVAVTWLARGDTIAEAIANAYSSAEAQEYGCGEYSVEIHAASVCG